MKPNKRGQPPKQAASEHWTRAEWIFGLLLTLGAVIFLLDWVRHAGGLWRDEVVSVTVATKPTWAAMWSALKYDSFPGLLHALLRLWSEVGLGATDDRLRILGVVVGFGTLAALWLNARALGLAAPILSLALFAFNPLAIQWTSSLRSYGLGMLFIFLSIACVWQLVERAEPGTVARAAVVTILSVQCLYQNAFLVAAICLGGFVVAARRGAWKTCVLVVAVGGSAAVSLIPYATILGELSGLRGLLVKGVTLVRIQAIFFAALRSPGGFMLWVWIVLFVAALVFAAVIQFPSALGRRYSEENGRVLFAAVVMAGGALGYLAYIKLLGLQTEPWYYLPPMAVSAVCLDAIVASAATRIHRGRAVRLGMALVIAGLAVPGTVKGVEVRQTNADLIALELEKAAGANDMILVYPWFFGATFERYYRGDAFWSTVPPHADIQLQRLDLLREQMVAVDPLGPLLDRAARTLQSGNRIWLVGEFPAPPQGKPPLRMPPAPGGPLGWDIRPYVASWGQQVVSYLRSHAQSSNRVTGSFRGPVRKEEDLKVLVVTGWRG